MAVLPYTAEQWRRFLTEAGRADLLAQPWFATGEGRHDHIDELYRAIADALSQRSTAAWAETLSKIDVPFAPVASLQSLISDPHLTATGFFETGPDYPASIRRKLPQAVAFAGIAAQPDQPPHALGADTRVVLRECGYADPEIEEMIRKGEVAAAKAAK